MTDTLRTPPPPTAAPQHRRLFTLDPGRWEAERSGALRTGHVRDHTWAPAIPGSLRFSAAAVALISLLAGLFAMGHGVPVEAALPGMVLAPLLAEHLPRWLLTFSGCLRVVTLGDPCGMPVLCGTRMVGA
ncbi:hypothetical protein [Streptomyces mirabilis]|uniref:hypothetical protein n=1 Tax=Streptomyces mirabilis TaxID=68239 RepID=UPI0033A1B9D1